MILPNPAKAGDGKLQGRNSRGIGSQLHCINAKGIEQSAEGCFYFVITGFVPLIYSTVKYGASSGRAVGGAPTRIGESV